MSVLRLKKANCKNCYKCIRNCPIKSIEVKDDQAQIISSDCILCGRCVLVCPQNAKEVRHDVPRVKELLASGRRVVASVAPSFITDFPVSGIGEFEGYLKQLGFAAAAETATGAYVVKTEYEKILERQEQNVVISSCCPTVVRLIEKYYPAVVGNVAPVKTPMQVHGELLKAQYPDAAVVFIGPCISKKGEAEELGGIIDVVLTFEELTEWFREEGIEIKPSETLEENRFLSRFFPVSGGIIKTMKRDDRYKYLIVDGVESCIDAIKEIENGTLKNCFIEMSACKGSCIAGPSIRKFTSATIASQIQVENYAVSSPQRDYDVQQPVDPYKKIRDDYVNVVQPSENQILTILQKMGKYLPDDQLNCGACGYPSCREKAIAVYFGKADITMCLPYMRQRAESFSDKIIDATPNGIITVDTHLKIQQINSAACAIFNLRSPRDAIGTPVDRLFDSTDIIQLIAEEKPVPDRKEFLPDYNKYVDRTLVYDKSSGIVICIFKDITEREMQSEHVKQMKNDAAEITNKVIEKQMRVVQEIASLLGETTAETKVALTKLKNTVLMEEE